MYDDSWYSFVPEIQGKQGDRGHTQKFQHQRRESLLKQPNDSDRAISGQADPLTGLFEELALVSSPPEATIARRAKSYSDFYHVARAQLTKDAKKIKKAEQDPVVLVGLRTGGLDFESMYETYEDDLLDASQEEFQLYRDQLALSRRHLDSLIQDASLALDLLAGLSNSFRSVEAQTTAFQAQCEDLLAEQKHLKLLSKEVGYGLQYYAFLEPITRRLNAPGAASVIGDDGFVEMLSNLDACIQFMMKHPGHRESDIYLTRYKSLLARTLNLFRTMFAKMLRDNTAQAKEAELMRRIEPGKVTMVSLYVFQAPESKAEVDMYKKTVELIVGKAETAIDESPRVLQERPGYSEYLSIYEETLKSLTQDYISIRSSAVPYYVGMLLTKTIADDFDPRADFPRYARECLNAVLEICANESVKYLSMFGANWGTMKYRDRSSLILLGMNTGAFKEFLSDICQQVFAILQNGLQKVHISHAVELVVWMNSYGHYPAMSGEMVSLHSDEEGEEDGPGIPKQAKAHVSGQLSSMIINTIFARIKEILLKDVERYSAKSSDIVPQRPVSQDSFDATSTRDGEAYVHDDIGTRLEKALGFGIRGAYPPVKASCRLLLYINDLTFEYSGDNGSSDVAYEILHQTCTAIMRGVDQIMAKASQLDGRLFAIKNLVLLKNLVLAYEIAGSRRASVLDFKDLWATFAELRVRGGLFDIGSYYNLLTSGKLLPKVVESVQDARVELDGLLRENITIFREESAKMILKDNSGRKRGVMSAEEQIKEKLMITYPREEKLRDNLWEAVQSLMKEKKLER